VISNKEIDEKYNLLLAVNTKIKQPRKAVESIEIEFVLEEIDAKKIRELKKRILGCSNNR
jgi:hypothetical protein